MKVISKIVVGLIITGLIVIGIIFALPNQDKLVKSLTIMNPVEIDSDEELLDFVTSNGFVGDGSENKPYLIDYIWISNITEVSFRMFNTRSHVIIENSVFENSTRQKIWLWNAENVVVRQNEMSGGSGDGIYVNSSRSIFVLNNRIWDIKPVGIGLSNGLSNFPVSIDVQYSTFVTVSGNLMHDTFDGIWFWGYNNQSVIEDNRIERMTTHGIGFGGAENHNLIVKNNFINDVIYGMWLLGAEGDSIIDGNTIISAFDGIRTFSDNLTVTNNFFEDVRNFGIWMQSNQFAILATNYLIEANTFVDIQREAIYFEQSGHGNNVVRENNFVNINLANPEASVIRDDGVMNVIHQNYYANFSSFDDDGDGFYDTPYIIAGTAQNEDTAPRVEMLPFTKIE